MKKYHVGITVGVYDLFHVGHLNLLEKSKAQCDHLIVAVLSDEYSIQKKGKKPVYSLEERMRLISALKCVDEVITIPIEEVADKSLLYKRVKFDAYFSGDDWKDSEIFKRTEKLFAELGVDLVYFPYTKGVSSTSIKESINDTDINN